MKLQDQCACCGNVGSWGCGCVVVGNQSDKVFKSGYGLLFVSKLWEHVLLWGGTVCLLITMNNRNSIRSPGLRKTTLTGERVKHADKLWEHVLLCVFNVILCKSFCWFLNLCEFYLYILRGLCLHPKDKYRRCLHPKDKYRRCNFDKSLLSKYQIFDFKVGFFSYLMCWTKTLTLTLKKMTKKWQKRAKSAFSNALLGEQFSDRSSNAVLRTGAPLGRCAGLRCAQFNWNCENDAQFLSEFSRNAARAVEADHECQMDQDCVGLCQAGPWPEFWICVPRSLQLLLA